jgi:hypothetical protein
MEVKMEKQVLKGAAIALLLITAFTGCGNPAGSETNDAIFTVTFNAAGGSPDAKTRLVYSGTSVGAAMPAVPTKDGHAFDGWYTETNGGGTPFTAELGPAKGGEAFLELQGYTLEQIRARLSLPNPV